MGLSAAVDDLPDVPQRARSVPRPRRAVEQRSAPADRPAEQADRTEFPAPAASGSGSAATSWAWDTDRGRGSESRRDADAEREADGGRRGAATGVRGRASVGPRLPREDDALGASRIHLPTVATSGLPERPSRPLPSRGEDLRVILDHVQVSTFGLDATVEVRLALGDRHALGEASGPAVDGYVLRLCGVAAAASVNAMLVDEATGTARGRCFVEQAALVPLGSCEVAVVVVLLVCDGWVEQLSGSALVSGDPRHAVVRATLAAVNRRLGSLLP